MDRFLIRDRNTGSIISATDCLVIDTFDPEIQAMADYWSDPNVETDVVAVRLIELFGRDLSTILAGMDLSV